jgi:hypothetical protein
MTTRVMNSGAMKTRVKDSPRISPAARAAAPSAVIVISEVSPK